MGKISKESNKLKQILEILQELQTEDNIDLSDAEKDVLETFIDKAQEKELISPIASEEAEHYENFTLDEGIKEIFTEISHEAIVEIVNYMGKARFNCNRDVDFKFTEYFKVKGDKRKRFIRGDFSGEIEGGLDDESTNIITLEFQASHRKDVPSRVHAYGNNNLLLTRKKVKPEMKEEDVYIRPFELVIYTSTKYKQKEGDRKSVV